jgi:hypothetical protein
MELSFPSSSDANKTDLNDAGAEQSGELSEENQQGKASRESSSDDYTGGSQENNDEECTTENKLTNENITEANHDNSENTVVEEGPEAESHPTAVVEGPELQPTAEQKILEESDNSDL